MIPILTINGDRISTAEDGKFKFLGMPVRVCSSNEEARSSLQETLRKMLSAIDVCNTSDLSPEAPVLQAWGLSSVVVALA